MTVAARNVRDATLWLIFATLLNHSINQLECAFNID